MVHDRRSIDCSDGRFSDNAHRVQITRESESRLDAEIQYKSRTIHVNRQADAWQCSLHGRQPIPTCAHTCAVELTIIARDLLGSEPNE